jgi:hypothetical protein
VSVEGRTFGVTAWVVSGTVVDGTLVVATFVSGTIVDGWSERPSTVMMTAVAEATAITMNIQAAAAAAIVSSLPTGRRRPADLVESLSTAARRAGETATTAATATAGATIAADCSSDTKPESESMPAEVLPVPSAGLGSEGSGTYSGRRVKGIVAPASVGSETGSTFTPTLHGVKSI